MTYCLYTAWYCATRMCASLLTPAASAGRAVRLAAKALTGATITKKARAVAANATREPLVFPLLVTTHLRWRMEHESKSGKHLKLSQWFSDPLAPRRRKGQRPLRQPARRRTAAGGGQPSSAGSSDSSPARRRLQPRKTLTSTSCPQRRRSCFALDTPRCTAATHSGGSGKKDRVAGLLARGGEGTLAELLPVAQTAACISASVRTDCF